MRDQRIHMRLEQMLVLQPVKRYQVSWFNGGINAMVSSREKSATAYWLILVHTAYSTGGSGSELDAASY